MASSSTMIENRSKQLLIVARNSGPSVYLAPGGTAVVPRAEVDGNSKIEKLVRLGALWIGEPPKKPRAESEPRPKKAKSHKR